MVDLYKSGIDYWSNVGDMKSRYWDNQQYINRSKAVANVLKGYTFESIFEVGMCNGRNLFYIEKQFPNVKIGGCDINKVALEFARNNLPQKISIIETDILNLNTEEKFDVVFTHGVLMHIDPSSISAVIDKIIQKSNKYIMHIERRENNNNIVRGPAEINPGKESKKFCWEPVVSDFYQQKGIKTIYKESSNFGMNEAATLTILGI